MLLPVSEVAETSFVTWASLVWLTSPSHPVSQGAGLGDGLGSGEGLGSTLKLSVVGAGVGSLAVPSVAEGEGSGSGVGVGSVVCEAESVVVESTVDSSAHTSLPGKNPTDKNIISVTAVIFFIIYSPSLLIFDL